MARVRIARVGRKICAGEIDALLETSPDRREPRCAVFGACGGCQLQHLARAGQLEAKVLDLRDCLRRIGGISWPGEIPIHAGPEFEWRSRTELQVDPRTGKVGYFRPRSRDLVAIDDCPILVPALRAEVRRLAAAAAPAGPDRLALAAGDDGSIVHGAREARQTVLGVDYLLRADSFWQGNRPLLETLVRSACGEDRGRVAVDLYAGAGLFALQLARHFAIVHAVEVDAASGALLAENARANGAVNVRAAAQEVERWILASSAPRRPDLVLLDPPRIGAGPAVVAGIAALEPARITYVSCDPPTLARDLRDLVQRGFRIESIVALDLFPQSYHVEVVARLAPIAP
ncbi:MAG: class I SAM-dependent RNA methyltransferase [Planctomycetota bacterium]